MRSLYEFSVLYEQPTFIFIHESTFGTRNFTDEASMAQALRHCQCSQLFAGFIRLSTSNWSLRLVQVIFTILWTKLHFLFVIEWRCGAPFKIEFWQLLITLSLIKCGFYTIDIRHKCYLLFQCNLALSLRHSWAVEQFIFLFDVVYDILKRLRSGKFFEIECYSHKSLRCKFAYLPSKSSVSLSLGSGAGFGFSFFSFFSPLILGRLLGLRSSTKCLLFMHVKSHWIVRHQRNLLVGQRFLFKINR